MKKRWILSSILILFFGITVLYLLLEPLFNKRVTDSSYEDVFTIENIKETLLPEPLCYVQDELEYYYYEEKDPLWEPNNKFGLYVYAEEKDFFEIAQNLVNSNGGEWGYVLIPYNMDDRDLDKWNRVFGQLHNKKLIPIIQLWKLDKDNYKNQTEEVAIFLNRFVWPIKYRYISVYNEPNDASFWFGEVNPKEYAEILDHTINIFKKVSPDYFMINGAFNVSASNSISTMDSFNFMQKMNEAVPGVFEELDGWASHPYPQPNFSGSPYGTGRWSIKAYENELSYLYNTLGVEKELPVFITETGWAHAEGENYNSTFYSVETIGEYFKYAFENVWLTDKRVRAVTPFTIRYNPPYDHFSWINKDKVPYKHYEVIKGIDKEKGEPPIIAPGTVSFAECEK